MTVGVGGGERSIKQCKNPVIQYDLNRGGTFPNMKNLYSMAQPNILCVQFSEHLAAHDINKVFRRRPLEHFDSTPPVPVLYKVNLNAYHPTVESPD